MTEGSGLNLSVAGLFADRDAQRRRDQQAAEQLQRRKEEELAAAAERDIPGPLQTGPLRKAGG